jgi:hypothetical protein
MADMHTPETDPTLIREPGSPPAGHALPGGPEPVREELTRPAGTVPVDHQLPESSGPSHYAGGEGAADPELARREILQTRSRMSDTIDQIEEQILRRKERLQAQLDVRGQLRERLTPVRELVERQPLAVFGGVLGAGLLLGYLTGERDEAEAPRGPRLSAGEDFDVGGRNGWRRRARGWEARSRELMRINAELEDEVRRLREDLDDDAGESGGWLSGVARAVGGILGRAGATEVETVVEIEEEDLPGDYHPSVSYDQFSQGQRVREPGDPLAG